MSGARLEVQWSPLHTDKFISWGTEIYLYEVVPLKNDTSAKISETTAAELLATNSNYHYVKCIDIYPHSESDVLLAVGQANGKVALTTFGPTSLDCLGLVGKELAPRHGRQCNTVSWNPVEPNLIAAGLDKYRADHSVLLWDLKRCPNPSHDGHSSHHLSLEPSRSIQPIAELGLSETAHSLAWLRSQPRSLVVGLHNKYLKIFDLRDAVKVVNVTTTKAVYGVSVDPQADHRLSTFVDNQIFIWDTRNFERPVLSLPQSKPIIKLMWCPTRGNLLGSLQRDSCAIGLHDIQPTMVGNDEVEPSVLDRSIQLGTSGAITSFSWHPSHENRLINVNLSGVITDYTVFERITLNWSPSSHIVWTHGWRTLKTVSDKDPVYGSMDCEALLIRKRALNQYGLKVELCENGDLAENESLKKLWNWLYLSQTLGEKGLISNSNTRHPGVRSVLKKLENCTPAGGISSAISIPWSDLPNCQSHARMFRSEEREQALLLCGWRERDTFLDQLESEGQFSRAAAIAVFSLRLRLAVDILHRAAKHSRNAAPAMVAMALSGFSDDKTSMWREQSLSACSHLNDPYLRVMFAFLTSESDTYETVLEENNVAVEDRVAFACLFLSDSKLMEFLRNLTIRLTEEGDLGGMLLTGASQECIPLLQRFLDKTGDIQSTSLIAARACPVDVLQDERVQEWISSYRNLLDSWRLWTQRAHFDIALNASSDIEKPTQQVFVSCNFCGKSISAFMQGRGRGIFARLGATANKLKISSCPNCRKPLPRCAICLMNMGTASGALSRTTNTNSGKGSNTDSGTNSERLADFSSWFTWCQSCRHGGHAEHMMNWFRIRSECPVAACLCRCVVNDGCLSRLTSFSQHEL